MQSEGSMDISLVQVENNGKNRIDSHTDKTVMIQSERRSERVSQRRFKRKTEINRIPLKEINFSDALMIQIGKRKIESMGLEDTAPTEGQGPTKGKDIKSLKLEQHNTQVEGTSFTKSPINQ